MTGTILDKMDMSERDKASAIALSRELHRAATHAAIKLLHADVIDNEDDVIHAAFALVLETRPGICETLPRAI